MEGDTINETQVYLEGGARNLQVGIKEVTSYKTKPQKNKKKWLFEFGLKNDRNARVNANFNISGGSKICTLLIHKYN